MGVRSPEALPVKNKFREQAIAINIEVPVRVFEGDEFVDNLSIKDFEVYEDGVLQVEKVTRELKEKLKKDVLMGNAEYKSIIRDIIGGETRLDLYLRLKELRRLEQKKLLDSAETLKQVEGQKNVFLLYQQDAIPVTIAPMDNITPEDLLSSASELRLDIAFDVDKVKQAYSDLLISAYFIYITSTEVDGPKNMRLEDWSMNIFSAFNEVAKATGGLVESSTNPAFSFEKAAEASEKYYLLYYTPKKYIADGKFKNIEVKVKGKDYRITHRDGYIADWR